MKKKHNLFIFVIILALVASLIYMMKSERKPEVPPLIKASVANIDFVYKSQYGVYEKKNSPFTGALSTITLYEDTDLNRKFFKGEKGSPQEPPTTISIDIYNNPNSVAPQQLLGTNASYMFAQGEGADIAVGGQKGKLITWNGLYKGRSIIVTSKGLTYVFSVTSRKDTDTILSDYIALVNSLAFK